MFTIENPGRRRGVPASVALFLFPVALCLFSVTEVSATGKEPKKRVAVADFQNEAGYSWHKAGSLGGGMAEKLVEALINTGKFVVLERQDLMDVVAEHNLGSVAKVEPAVIGRLTSAQALIRGVITNVDEPESQKGGLKLGKFKIRGQNEKVTVKINLRVIDTVTGQVLQSKSVVGKAWARGVRIRKQGGDSDVEMKRNDTVAKALDDAISEAVSQIVDGMESVPWQGSVSRVSGRQIIINAGYQENVESGLQLRVFERGAEIIDRDTNETLGRLDEAIGVIRVVRVEPRFAIAEVVEGQGIAQGNIVRPLATFD